MTLLPNAAVTPQSQLSYLRSFKHYISHLRAASNETQESFHLTFSSLVWALTMVWACVGGAPAASSGVNWSAAFLLPLIDHRPEDKPQSFCSPAPSHPLFVHVSPQRYLPHLILIRLLYFSNMQIGSLVDFKITMYFNDDKLCSFSGSFEYFVPLLHMCQTQGPGAKSGPWWI